MTEKNTQTRKSSGRMKRIVKGAALGLAGVLGVAIAAFFVWAFNVSPAEPGAYAAATSNQTVMIGSKNGFITIRPATSTSEIGLLFYPGARIASEAYVAKLSAIAVADNIQIVIGRPFLNLAFFSINQADDMRAALSGVTRWYVGGHSLGGSMACVYASSHSNALEGVVLFGTYCGKDISNSSLRVLSINGVRDGVFPPEIISEKRYELPSNARMVRVSGMNHAQIGNYGPQPGDNEPTISDAEARQALVDAIKAFFTEP